MYCFNFNLTIYKTFLLLRSSLKINLALQETCTTLFTAHRAYNLFAFQKAFIFNTKYIITNGRPESKSSLKIHKKLTKPLLRRDFTTRLLSQAVKLRCALKCSFLSLFHLIFWLTPLLLPFTMIIITATKRKQNLRVLVTKPSRVEMYYYCSLYMLWAG